MERVILARAREIAAHEDTPVFSLSFFCVFPTCSPPFSWTFGCDHRGGVLSLYFFRSLAAASPSLVVSRPLCGALGESPADRQRVVRPKNTPMGTKRGLAAAVVACARGHRVRVDRVGVVGIAVGALCDPCQLDETARAPANLLDVGGRRVALASRRVVGALFRVAATPIAPLGNREGRVARCRIRRR